MQMLVAAYRCERRFVCLKLDTDLKAVDALDDDELGKWFRRSPRPVRRFRTNAAPHLLHLDEVPDHLLGEMSTRKARMRARLYLENTKLQRRITKLLAEGDQEYEPVSNVEGKSTKASIRSQTTDCSHSSTPPHGPNVGVFRVSSRISALGSLPAA
jgi:hypothetical protein